MSLLSSRRSFLMLMPMSHFNDNDDSRSLSPARKLKDIFEELQDINLEDQIVDQEREQLGLGFSCDVFRAWSTAHNKIVAVKRIRFFLLEDISFASNLGREVRLWSKLNHPNVLPLLGYCLEGPKSIPNLVSEWMKNGTVIDYMKDRPFNAFEMCIMVHGIASGLHYIHTEQSMIHADLKGSNILVSDDGGPLLADFGLSVSSSSASLGATTYHGQKGTLRWMAKELHSNSLDSILEIPKHTTMTDMWAFGMVISELFTCKVPYWTITVDRLVTTAVLGGQLPQEPDFQDFPNGFVLRGLWAIGRACWHDDPQKRPSASYVSNELAIFMNYLEENPKGVSRRDYLHRLLILRNEISEIEHERDPYERDLRPRGDVIKAAERTKLKSPRPQGEPRPGVLHIKARPSQIRNLTGISSDKTAPEHRRVEPVIGRFNIRNPSNAGGASAPLKDLIVDATKKVSMAAGGFAPYPPLIHSQAVFNAFTPLSLLDNSGLQNEDEDEDGPWWQNIGWGEDF